MRVPSNSCAEPLFYSVIPVETAVIRILARLPGSAQANGALKTLDLISGVWRAPPLRFASAR